MSLRRPLMSLRRNNIDKSLRRLFMKAPAVSDVSTHDVRPFEDIPGPSGVYNIPFFGPMFHFKPFTNYSVENLHMLYNSLMDRYGSLVRVKLGQWMVLVEEGQDIEKVIRSEGRFPDRPLPLIHVWYCENHGATKGFGILSGEEWHRLRRPVNAKLLKRNSAYKYLPIQNQVGDELVDCLERMKTPEEIQDLFFRYACESICSVVFSERLGYLREEANSDAEKMQILRDLREIFVIFNNALTIPPAILMNFPLKIKQDYKAAADNIINYVEKHYSSVMKSVEEGEEGGDHRLRCTFAYSLMKSANISVQEMGAIALDLFAAGSDSTAWNLQIFFLNLARHPEKQQKLYEEIARVVGRGPVKEEHLEDLKYLAACIKESMRMHYPTITGVQRFLPEDIVLQGYRIPAGTMLSLMNQRIVKNEKYFPKPWTFEPERWLRDERGQRAYPIPTYALLPFGFGPRQCIGKRFAEQEINLGIIKILQNFEVSLDPSHKQVEVIYRIFVGPKKPINFTFKRRDNGP